jgi:putative lipoic acid-binding regulatory protein
MSPSVPDPPQLLLDFPCDYVFKAFGPGAASRFAADVRRAVETVMPIPLDAVKIRPSAQGTYQAVSVVLMVHNLEQVHAVYRALKTVPDLKYLL